MKSIWLATTLFALSCLLAGAEDRPAVTFIGHDQVAATFAKGGPLAMGEGYRSAGARRTGPGKVEVHDKETDIIYVVDGEATFVTGGTMIGGKQTRADQWLGTDIQGGDAHHLVKGDMVVIPAGVPHWFKEVPRSVNYYLVKVVKD
jgi:mannose-6-phosphate isomerase-like protein (cupin superfamily)